MEYVLKTTNITKRYRKFNALNGVSMEVPKGSIYGFVGKNGAGKTTTIRIICGLQMPNSGSFILNGVKNDVVDIDKARRKLGAIVEAPALYEDLSAKGNLSMQLDILGIKDKSKIDDLLKLVGLSKAGKKKAGKFSLGMKQRLGIAMALCGDPDFLILDEPINGLDPEGIIEIRELILKLNKEKNITVLISSHYLDELSRIATHYGFIKDGKLVKEISASELQDELRKCIRVVANKELKNYLDKKKYNYKMISDKEALIYDDVEITPLVVDLNKNNINIEIIENKVENLEEYFLELIGANEDVKSN